MFLEHEQPADRERLGSAGVMRAWRPELLAYFDTGRVSNGATEAMII